MGGRCSSGGHGSDAFCTGSHEIYLRHPLHGFQNIHSMFMYFVFLAYSGAFLRNDHIQIVAVIDKLPEK